MTGGETSLSGNDDSSLPLRYTPGYEQLYINGVLQVRGGDYTATTGTTVTGLTALVANDVVEIFSAVARTVADVYTQTQSDARFVNRNVGGLNLVIPTGATNGTVGANGAVTIGSAVSSVTVNGAFSSAYDSYKIIVSGGAASTSDRNFNIRLDGSTGSTTGYYYCLLYGSYSGGGTALAGGNNVNGVTYVGTADTNGLSADITLVNPFLSKWTTVNASLSGLSIAGTTTGVHQVATSYSGFVLTLNSGTITGGTIRIYGYNNGA
jgi:hypothetical protein